MLFSYTVLAVSCASLASGLHLRDELHPRQTKVPIPAPISGVNTCNGATYNNAGLIGYGLVPATARDKYNDTISIGSSIAIEGWRTVATPHGKGQGKGKASKPAMYTATLWGLPDRGWNTRGTVNFQPRVHKFRLVFTPGRDAAQPVANGAGARANLQLTYLDTVLLTDMRGVPMTGLDPQLTAPLAVPGYWNMPAATVVGDGFSKNATGEPQRRVALDPEGIVLAGNGSFWLSDEYGPGLYKFNSAGRMIDARRVPEALIPRRNGTAESYSASSAPLLDPNFVIKPADPVTGRANNQGLEGLTVSPDGKTLYTLLQSSAIQDGGSKPTTRYHPRFLVYDVTGPASTSLKAEYVVRLPTYVDAKNATKVAAQSEIHYVSPTQFMVLVRDSGAGHGLPLDTSVLRRIDIFDIRNATNILGKYDAANGTLEASSGTLKPGIVPATNCRFIDINDNTELSKFGLHNGAPNNAALLNEKWEGLALVPVAAEGKHHEKRGGDNNNKDKDSSEDYGKNKGHGGKGHGDAGNDGDNNDEYFLFTASDNDFVTTNGAMNFGKFPYSEGLNADNQVLVYKVKLPKGSRPLIG